MSTSTELGYLGLEVSDLAAWRRFATEMLGLEVGAPRADGALPLRMDDHQYRFLLHQGPADDVAYIGWEVPDAAALDGLAGRLAGAGVEVRSGSAEETAARGVAALAVFRDPNGIRSEICFGLRRGSGDFRSPRMASGFHTAGLGMGHVLVNARNCAETERFYRDVLGFRLSDYVDTEIMGHNIHAVFLHVNPRHHSLAFAEMQFPKRLHHFMLEVNALDDVGAAYNRCGDLGVPLALTMGRHQNDRMVSFYGVNPSGFLFEVGWDGLMIDDRTWQPKTHRGISGWGHRPAAPK